jgi:hypothetical protein
MTVLGEHMEASRDRFLLPGDFLDILHLVAEPLVAEHQYDVLCTGDGPDRWTVHKGSVREEDEKGHFA